MPECQNGELAARAGFVPPVQSLEELCFTFYVLVTRQSPVVLVLVLVRVRVLVLVLVACLASWRSFVPGHSSFARSFSQPLCPSRVFFSARSGEDGFLLSAASASPLHRLADSDSDSDTATATATASLGPGHHRTLARSPGGPFPRTRTPRILSPRMRTAVCAMRCRAVVICVLWLVGDQSGHSLC